MSSAVDLASKVLAALAGLLGLAGYVLVLGATILWFRLNEVGLPNEVPISLAGRQELIAIGARAVAVWLLLVVVLGGLAAWIITGDPERRRFERREAALALAVTVSAVIALEGPVRLLVVLPGTVALVTAIWSWWKWPSTEAVTASVLPLGVGLGLAFALYGIHGNGLAEAAGATFIFGALVLLAPPLQQWRARQEANRAAIAQITVKAQASNGCAKNAPDGNPLIKALERHGRPESHSGTVLWIRRVALGLVALLILGVIAVASQVERDENFHQAVVSLTNGDCVVGTYVVRGGEQIVLAQPSLAREEEEEEEGKRVPQPRIMAIPTKEVLKVQVYGKASEGTDLVRDAGCANYPDLVQPKKEDGNDASPGSDAS
jgi:hypothetical protein